MMTREQRDRAVEALELVAEGEKDSRTDEQKAAHQLYSAYWIKVHAWWDKRLYPVLIPGRAENEGTLDLMNSTPSNSRPAGRVIPIQLRPVNYPDGRKFVICPGKDCTLTQIQGSD